MLQFLANKTSYLISGRLGPNAFMDLVDGNTYHPNQKTCKVEFSQNLTTMSRLFSTRVESCRLCGCSRCGGWVFAGWPDGDPASFLTSRKERQGRGTGVGQWPGGCPRSIQGAMEDDKVERRADNRKGEKATAPEAGLGARGSAARHRQGAQRARQAQPGRRVLPDRNRSPRLQSLAPRRAPDRRPPPPGPAYLPSLASGAGPSSVTTWGRKGRRCRSPSASLILRPQHWLAHRHGPRSEARLQGRPAPRCAEMT